MRHKRQRIYPIKIPITKYPNFSDRLTLALEFRNLSGTDLAKRLFVTPSTISGYRRGVRLPNCLMLCRIAQELEVSTDYLLGLDEYIFLSFEEKENLFISDK